MNQRTSMKALAQSIVDAGAVADVVDESASEGTGA
jgi:hypothetical protein